MISPLPWLRKITLEPPSRDTPTAQIRYAPHFLQGRAPSGGPRLGYTAVTVSNVERLADLTGQSADTLVCRVEERARGLVEEHETTIAAVAAVLLERWTITGDQLREIVAALERDDELLQKEEGAAH